MSSINGVDDRKSKKVDDKNVEQNLNCEKIFLYFYFVYTIRRKLYGILGEYF